MYTAHQAETEGTLCSYPWPFVISNYIFQQYILLRELFLNNTPKKHVSADTIAKYLENLDEK